MYGLPIFCFNCSSDLAENILQLTQRIHNRSFIRHADIRPHIRIGGGNARRIFEPATDEFKTRIQIIAAAVEQCDERCCRQVRDVADDRCAAVMSGEVERCKVRPRCAREYSSAVLLTSRGTDGSSMMTYACGNRSVVVRLHAAFLTRPAIRTAPATVERQTAAESHAAHRIHSPSCFPHLSEWYPASNTAESA